jgi:hypothetical protein
MSSRNDAELFVEKAGQTAVNENLGVGGRHHRARIASCCDPGVTPTHFEEIEFSQVWSL